MGSLALAAYVCAKAGADARRVDFQFEDLFFRKLMGFLETDELAQTFVNLNQLLRGEKQIRKTADATHGFLNELLQGGDEFSTQEALLGNEKTKEMLANHNLSPDEIFFNATNIAPKTCFTLASSETSTWTPMAYPIDQSLCSVAIFSGTTASLPKGKLCIPMPKSYALPIA